MSEEKKVKKQEMSFEEMDDVTGGLDGLNGTNEELRDDIRAMTILNGVPTPETLEWYSGYIEANKGKRGFWF